MVVKFFLNCFVIPSYYKFYYFQDVRLIKFNIKNEIPLNYNPGDVFNIRPRNSKEDIEDLFNILDTHGLDIKPHYRLLIEECHEGMY